METRTKNIVKAGLCLIALMILVVPSAMADIRPKMPLSTVVYSSALSNCVSSDSSECTPGVPQSFVVHNLVRGVSNRIVFQQNSNSYTYDSSGAPVGGDSGNCGVTESLSQVMYSSSYPLVHLFNSQVPPPYLFIPIYCPFFLRDLRQGRTKAYVVIPGIDHKLSVGDDQWIQSPWLGGALVWEDAIVPYTYVGQFGWFVGSSADHVYPYRNRLTMLDEVARGYESDGSMWVRFELSSSIVSDTGFVFNDIIPYVNDASCPVK